MCGLAGFFSKKGITTEQVLKTSAAIAHRGPDGEGFYCVSKDGEAINTATELAKPEEKKLPHGVFETALIHRRLSIVELSRLGHQPMQSENGNLILLFNGEIYNYRELLIKHGLQHAQRSNCDTEAILHLYQKCGTAIFKEMRGMWAIAIYHTQKNQLVLSRDRFGIKPLYMAAQPEFFAFSSEIKPLLLCPEVPPVVKTEKLIEYLFYGATADPAATFFDKIEEVPPATFLEVDLNTGTRRSQTYYTPGAENHPGNFFDLFSESVKEHLMADVSVGSCLSGGLDSSSIVVAAAKAGLPLVQTYTCSFPGTDADESGYARLLADHLPNLEQHFTTPTADEFMRDMDRLILAQELPIGSSSVYAQYRVMQLAASQGSKVVLDGQGADEIFGGYYNFAGVFLWNLLAKAKFKAFLKEFQSLQENFNPAMAKAMARASYYWLPESMRKLARKKERLGAGLISDKDQYRLKYLSGPERGGRSFRELSQKSISFGLRELLHYEDRNSMVFSIESRVPFLDHRLVDYALNLKPGKKMVDGWTKYPIRKYLQQHGVPDLAWRKDKKGFVTPQQLWRHKTLPILKEQMAAAPIPDFMDKKALQGLLNADLSSNEHLSEFWRIVALLRWLELFKVQTA